MQSESRLKAIEQVTDLPLTILAIVLVPLLVLPLLFELPEGIADSFEIADGLIWGVFAAVFLLKIVVAPRRASFLAQNWVEACLVLLPMLRPLRAARVLRLARVATVVGFNFGVAERLFASRNARAVAIATLVVLVGGAGLVLAAEHDAPESNIHSFGDALWWAVVTVTTVGYGDQFPVTPFGKGVATALMIVGIAVVSTLTASIAALIVREHEDVELTDILTELKELRKEVAALRAAEPDQGGERAGGPS